ncbi:MAG: hypothetical protein HY514_04525 [Candidatus Aenigmarchaeota archaeon]|nr:hypothetical protein [Candidatus Aenigmarchaeota archaeon]
MDWINDEGDPCADKEKLEKLGAVRRKSWEGFAEALKLIPYAAGMALYAHARGQNHREKYHGNVTDSNETFPVTIEVEHYAGAHYVFGAKNKKAIRDAIHAANDALAQRKTAQEEDTSQKEHRVKHGTGGYESWFTGG